MATTAPATSAPSTESSAPTLAPASHPTQAPAPDPNAPLIADDAASSVADNDSAFVIDSDESYTTSIASGVLNYKYENGRRYHSYREGQYVMPNDEKEQERLDLVHHIHRLVVDGALTRAPIGSNPQRVMDIGTGTGIWAIEFGDEYPSAEVIGTDLSPIQPSWVPPNVKFEVDDAESEWPYDAPFDYIHGRSLCGAIGDWPKLYCQALHHLRPGGWMESQEYEMWIHSDDGTLENFARNCVEYQERLDEASTKFGKQMNSVRLLEGKMRDAGFVDVRSDIYKVPLSPWAKAKKLKELGKFQQIATLDGLEPYGLALFTRYLGWTPEKVQLLLMGVRKELKDPRVHVYCKIHFIYGRKAEETAAV